MSSTGSVGSVVIFGPSWLVGAVESGTGAVGVFGSLFVGELTAINGRFGEVEVLRGDGELCPLVAGSIGVRVVAVLGFGELVGLFA